MGNLLEQTPTFARWLRELRDGTARAKIAARLEGAMFDNFGDCRPLGGGLSEMRLHYGPGYRVYYGQIGRRVYLLLAGGTKSAQARDIAKAREAWAEIKGDGKNGKV